MTIRGVHNASVPGVIGRRFRGALQPGGAAVGGGGVPNNAMLDEDNEPLLDEDGEFILDEET